MKNQRQSGVKREVWRICRALRALDRSLLRLAPMLAATVSMNSSPKENGRARPRLSPKARASMVLQGRYMGFMRQLKPRQKARVRKVREAKGVRAAIVKARDMAGA